MNFYLAALCAFGVCVVANFVLLPLLTKFKAQQQILTYVTEHDYKRGTPTMGGLSFIFTIVAVGLLFGGFSNRPFVVSLAVFASYGVVGFLDDFIKVHFRRNLGLRAYQKIIAQLVIAVMVALYAKGEFSVGDKLILPFSNRQVSIGFWILPLVVLVFLSCTNGVNLTDGIDGLATCSTLCYLFGVVLLLNFRISQANALGDTYALQTAANLKLLCFVSIGALLAFLLFNAHDAKVFMGDTGSLALGALVACVAIFSRLSLFIPLLGITFVVSCLSVILQVVYFRASGGRRLFLMAPFHHHLQKKGFSETRICTLYSVSTLAIIAVITCFGG